MFATKASAAIFTLVLLLSYQCHALETTHSIMLPELTGSYDSPGQFRSMDFDFEREFLNIKSVLLRVEFDSYSETVCAGNSCTFGTNIHVAIREPGVLNGPDPDFFPNYGFSPVSPISEMHADSYFATEYITLEDINGQLRFVSNVRPIDVLNDGKGSIAFQLGTGPAFISNVQLIVTTVAIPEPSTLVMGGGVLAFALARRKYLQPR